MAEAFFPILVIFLLGFLIGECSIGLALLHFSFWPMINILTRKPSRNKKY